MKHPLVQQLINARYAQDLNQLQVAERMGRWPSTIGAWESGARNPSLASLDEWAAALGLRITLTAAQGDAA
ncbi:helix-turn-helix domain-containing protein [Actinomadura bangladeshensis]|uniref:Helix-turn-helix transcriptional regulator n=1 Tax=Actinomadura bangladeshensis TaxID=453573 RepID=A0A6L9QAB9_9ACTN|nr:helix-turn-helix transcriptional regulator [Actinomadura bangladeshensis]NEA22523.1 helix-turn-helix transcriptional regulator [Actinomadura bangladeshensis]